MEIRVKEQVMGHVLRDRILAHYGSREALEEAADGGDAMAQVDLVDLNLLEEDPRRLEIESRREAIGRFSPEGVRLLTPARLELLDMLFTSEDEHNVTELAEALGRDKKNVSEDVATLVDLGLVRYERRGREKIPQPMGTEIRIIFQRQDAPGPEPAEA